MVAGGSFWWYKYTVMSRPYNYLPEISQEIVSAAAECTDQANIDYLRERQPALSQKSLQRHVKEFGADGQVYLDSLGLIYRAVDIAFTRDIGAILGADRLPSINPAELYVDMTAIREKNITAQELESKFKDQQMGAPDNKVLDRRLLDMWQEKSDPLFSEETRTFNIRKTMITGGLVMWLADSASRRLFERGDQ